jgi:nucleoid DNA-binding protein
MIGITQITQETNKKSKISSETTTKKVIQAFLQTVQQKLLQGESINFKGYFTIKRNTIKPKGNKNCDEHHKELEKFKQANKGKDVQFYAKSEKFKNLVRDSRNCKDCKKKKQDLAKSAKMINRVNFKPSKEFWKVGKKK